MLITCSPGYFWGMIAAAFVVGVILAHAFNRADRRTDARRLAEALALLGEAHTHIVITSGPVAAAGLIGRIRRFTRAVVEPSP